MSFQKSLYRLLDTFFKRRDIGQNYMTRWTISKTLRLYLHHFKHSDHDVMHDHPWNYVSLILWGGYYECTKDQGFIDWYEPGSILWRPAEWIHKIILSADRWNVLTEAWTLVWLGTRRRMWGFHCLKGFVPWKKFFSDGCPEVPAYNYTVPERKLVPLAKALIDCGELKNGDQIVITWTEEIP